MPDEIKPAPLLLAESATVYATANAFGQEQGNATAHLFAAAVDLLAACELADVSMDTAAMYGIGDVLPPEYRDSWVRAHRALQAAIAKAKGGAA